MTLPQTYLAALLLMILGMLCWGSWANTFKITGRWRFELFYFDYAIGVLAAALIYALTFGSLGFDGFSFMDDLMHAGKRQWALGFAGGVVFNLANMLLVAAISVAGMAVAFPVGIGMALIIGVVWNYLIRPQGNPILLFAGCGVIVAAIVVDALAYRALGIIRHEQLAKSGKAGSTMRRVSAKGIVLSLVSGVLMGCFYPLVMKGQEGEIGLGPYAIGAVFALGVFASTFVFNLFFMNLPVEGPPIEILDYFRGRFQQHVMGILGGIIWYTGTISSFVAASAPEEVHVGPAVSYAIGQGATMVSALWGLLVWKEFAGADTRVKSLVAIMLVLFACGLGLVSVAPLFARP
ncbi:MAG: AcrB/AcrD/AcrF family protein [Bryobacteraceae bacterium]